MNIIENKQRNSKKYSLTPSALVIIFIENINNAPIIQPHIATAAANNIIVIIKTPARVVS